MTHSTAAFGAFTLDLDTLALHRGPDRIPLEPQPTRLLALLVSRNGGLVSRDEAALCLWGHDTHVSEAEGLHYAIRRIRVALGDAASSPTFIETLPRRGYRFVAPVQFRDAGTPARRWRRPVLAAAAAAALLVIEALPNRHHETAVWLLETVHGVLY